MEAAAAVDRVDALKFPGRSEAGAGIAERVGASARLSELRAGGGARSFAERICQAQIRALLIGRNVDRHQFLYRVLVGNRVTGKFLSFPAGIARLILLCRQYLAGNIAVDVFGAAGGVADFFEPLADGVGGADVLILAGGLVPDGFARTAVEPLAALAVALDLDDQIGVIRQRAGRGIDRINQLAVLGLAGGVRQNGTVLQF